MARRRRVKRRKSGSKRGFISLPRLLVVLLLVVALGYFAFTKLFFDPTEEPHGRFDQLVPRDVEVFVHREALASDFNGWPDLRLQEAFRVSAAWKSFAKSQLWQEQTWPAEVQAGLDELDAALRDVPFDLLDDVLGREAVVVARQLESPETYALMARLSNRGKLAVSGALRFDGTLSESVPGLTIEERSNPERPGLTYSRLVTPEGDELFLKRDRDLLVLSRDELLLHEILGNVLDGGARSLALERLYAQHLPAASGAPDERFSTSFVVELGELVRVFEWQPNMLDPDRDLLADIWPTLLEPAILQRGLGRLEVTPDQLSLQLHADVDPEKTRASKGGLAGTQDFRVPERLNDLLRLMPYDTAGVITANVRLEDLLTTLLQNLDPATKSLIENKVKRVSALLPSSSVRSLASLVSELGRAFGDQLTIAVRRPDHEQLPGAQPLPLLAFLLPIDSMNAWKGVEDAVLTGGAEIGFDMSNSMQLDMGSDLLKWLAVVGLPFEEFAYITLDGELAVISTDRRFAEEIVGAYIGSVGVRSLQGEAKVRKLLERIPETQYGPARGNLALWFDRAAMWELIAPYADYVADLASVLDQATLRASERTRLLNADAAFRQWSRRPDTLPPEVEAQLDERLDAIMAEAQRERREVTIPKLAAAWSDGWAWRDLVSQVVASLRLGERDMDLTLLVETALKR
ncbi:MAG: hypothetical protein DHS20C15_19620 [Planctomycetota bacterium]|nr:MAG: hypothetical protein DHS20C15_19620 [Planctomycetota bacterium]